MKCRFFLTAGVILWCACRAWAVGNPSDGLSDLMKTFKENPSDAKVTVALLKELNKQGKSGQEVVDRYFQTQPEEEYYKEYNWEIVRDYVTDINAPQFKFLFKNQDRFIELYSKDDVYQKLDDVFDAHLEKFYDRNRADYEAQLKRIEEIGYAHFDVVSDYFYIRQLKAEKKAEDYFYKARKLFRYFPENRPMIKEITKGALEIMTDVSRLKVIQLWAGKTVESKTDFEAIYNYVEISQKCGFFDVAKRYASIAKNLASKSGDAAMQRKAEELMKMIN